MCLKTGNSRFLAYVIVPYHVYKEIIKLNGVVFKSKPIKIEDAKVKPKTRSQQCKTSGNSYNPIMLKQQTYHQQHQSQCQQLAAQYLTILQSPNQQNSALKSQYAMYQREQLKSNHQDQQKGNKQEVSKTNRENESLLTVPGERSYKETLITQKKNVIIFGDSIPKGINTRLLNEKLIKSKAACKFFPGATSKDFVHYIKPTLQENEFYTSILRMGVNDALKLGSNIDTVSKDIINIANHCKNFGVKQTIISGLTLTTRLKASFIYQLNKLIKELCQKHGYSFIDNSNVSSENL